MVERLEIRKFGPIDKIDIELKPIMVFIGKQATGKSTISKLIALFRGWEFMIGETKFDELLKHYSIHSYMNNESYIKFTCDAFTFELSGGQFNLSKVKDHSFHKKKDEYHEQKKLTPDNINIDVLTKELDDIKNELTTGIPSPDRENELINKQKELSIKIEQSKVTRNKFLEYVDQVILLENYSEYIPSERIFVSISSGLSLNLQKNKVPLPGTLLSFGAEFEKARAEIKSLDVDFLKAKYKYENNEDRIYVADDKYIPFKESASGFQTLLPMLIVIDYKTGKFQFNGLTFIIEEPELNLFPSAQKDLTKNLVEKCCPYILPKGKKFNNELVITTHSPYILSSLNNLLFAHRIAVKKPGSIAKLEEIIPKTNWIDTNKFSAYSLENGTIRSILDNETFLISESELDSASDYINNEFDLLMDVYRSKD